MFESHLSAATVLRFVITSLVFTFVLQVYSIIRLRRGQILYKTVSDVQYGNNKVIATDV